MPWPSTRFSPNSENQEFMDSIIGYLLDCDWSSSEGDGDTSNSPHLTWSVDSLSPQPRASGSEQTQSANTHQSINEFTTHKYYRYQWTNTLPKPFPSFDRLVRLELMKQTACVRACWLFKRTQNTT